MAGRKLFTNRSPRGMNVTLIVRASADPRNTAGTESFYLNPGQSEWHDYGNTIDIYLNGIKLIAAVDGDMMSQQYVVIIRGSPLDDALNRNNGVDFDISGFNFSLSTRQVT